MKENNRMKKNPEIWDAYLRDGTLAGCDLIRDEEIPEGLFHLVSEVIVRHKDGTYLLMQRDFRKQSFPGLYEASAGGSALKGENAYESAVRELREETGIVAAELEPIYCVTGKETIYHGFLCETSCDKNSITLQEGETISFLWLEKEEFLKFIETESYVPVQRERLKEFLDSIR